MTTERLITICLLFLSFCPPIIDHHHQFQTTKPNQTNNGRPCSNHNHPRREDPPKPCLPPKYINLHGPSSGKQAESQIPKSDSVVSSNDYVHLFECRSQRIGKRVSSLIQSIDQQAKQFNHLVAKPKILKIQNNAPSTSHSSVDELKSKPFKPSIDSTSASNLPNRKFKFVDHPNPNNLIRRMSSFPRQTSGASLSNHLNVSTSTQSSDTSSKGNAQKSSWIGDSSRIPLLSADFKKSSNYPALMSNQLLPPPPLEKCGRSMSGSSTDSLPFPPPPPPSSQSGETLTDHDDERPYRRKSIKSHQAPLPPATKMFPQYFPPGPRQSTMSRSLSNDNLTKDFKVSIQSPISTNNHVLPCQAALPSSMYQIDIETMSKGPSSITLNGSDCNDYINVQKPPVLQTFNSKTNLDYKPSGTVSTLGTIPDSDHRVSTCSNSVECSSILYYASEPVPVYQNVNIAAEKGVPDPGSVPVNTEETPQHCESTATLLFDESPAFVRSAHSKVSTFGVIIPPPVEETRVKHDGNAKNAFKIFEPCSHRSKLCGETFDSSYCTDTNTNSTIVSETNKQEFTSWMAIDHKASDSRGYLL